MTNIVLFGEVDSPITSSCTTCSGCSDKSEHRCTDNIEPVTSQELTNQLKESVKKAGFGDTVSVEFKDIHTEDLTDYPDVKTLINLSLSFPILTVNKKIKYMGPFEADKLLNELQEYF